MAYLNPGRMGLVGAPTYPMLRDATQHALLEILERDKIPYDLNKSDGVLTLRDTDSRIILRSMEEYERLRGTNLAWFGLDELTYTREEAWLRLEGRLRDPKAKKLGGFAVWTPKGFDWVYRRFIGAGKKNYKVILAKPYENRHLLKAVPDFYDRLRETYDEAFFQQEVLGQYLNVGGSRVYSAFVRAEHVRELSLDARLPILWALDFNVDPMCSVIAQIHRTEIRVLDEIVLHRASTRDACEEFSRRYAAHAGGVVVYGDASGRNMSSKGTSDYEMVVDHFKQRRERVDYRVPASNPSVRDRVAVTNAGLRNASGEIDMYVDPKCKELILDFEQVSYKEESTEVDKTKDRKRTHLSDALGYLIWQERRPAAPVGEQRNRLF